jgi:hypothetical protein
VLSVPGQDGIALRSVHDPRIGVRHGRL